MTPEEHEKAHRDAEKYWTLGVIQRAILAAHKVIKDEMVRIEREHGVTTDS